METANPTRVLVVAHRTAATPKLLAHVKERAERGPCEFTLLVPALPGDRDGRLSRETLALAIPLLEEAAHGRVRGIVGDSDPLLAAKQALAHEPFDEVTVSTLPEPVSHWLKRDLPSQIERLGLPVAVVKAEESPKPPFNSPHFRGV